MPLQEVSFQDRLWAAISYFPLLGWVYPYYFRKKASEHCRFHADQALYLNLLFLLLYFAIWLLENFPLTGIIFGSASLLSPILQTAWLLSQILYLALSGFSAYRAYRGETWKIPYLAFAMEKFIALVKKLKD